jgi:hypothetical protein
MSRAKSGGDPPSDDFIMRDAMDSQEVAVGWWPGDARYGKAAFYAYADPAPPGFAGMTLSPTAARWEPRLGEYILDTEDIAAARIRGRGAGIRPVGLPPRLRGVRVGHDPGGQRRGEIPSGQVTGTVSPPGPGPFRRRR